MRADKKDIALDENADSSGELSVIDGELIEDSSSKDHAGISSNEPAEIDFPKRENEKPETENQTYFVQYLLVPFLFVSVTLLGGLRISADAGEFVFWRPALVCLIFGAILLVLFFRAKLLTIDGWLNEKFSLPKNIINGLTLLTLFAASTQVFNSLIPEQGLPFWIVAFCFFWTLWTNLFAEFDTRRLLQSLGGLFGLAFVVKYLVLINLVPGTSESWMDILSLQKIGKETFSYLLDLPNFAGSTGYIQFFSLALYAIGLFLLKPKT